MSDLEKGTLYFRVDTASLLKEIAENGLPNTMGVLKVPLNVFRNLLCQVAQRASEIDDPKLNIIMLNLNLYEVSNNEIPKMIDKQQKRIKN